MLCFAFVWLAVFASLIHNSAQAPMRNLPSECNTCQQLTESGHTEAVPSLSCRPQSTPFGKSTSSTSLSSPPTNSSSVPNSTTTCFPSLAQAIPIPSDSATSASLTDWWCDQGAEYGFLGETTLLKVTVTPHWLTLAAQAFRTTGAHARLQRILQSISKKCEINSVPDMSGFMAHAIGR
jgi:hypothetical protein